MTNPHSVLPPSSAARRVACPGSRNLEAQFPQEDSSAADEGRLAHEVASAHLKDALRCMSNQYVTMDYTVSIGQFITQEMTDGARLYAESVRAVFDNLGTTPVTIYKIEETIPIINIHPECFGTPDFWFLGKDGLHIFDYKFGHGPVEVFENWQLIEYAAGIIAYLNGVQELKKQLNDCEPRVHFYIVQPRSYHRDGAVRKWETDLKSLAPYFETLLRTEHLAMQADAPRKPSEQCKHCSGRAVCPTLQDTALHIVDRSKRGYLQLSPRGIGNELRFLKEAADLLDSRITGLEQEAISHIKNGKDIPYFRLEETVGRRKWIKNEQEITALGDLFGYKLTKAPEAITPIQAIKAGVPEEIVNAYSESQLGALKLVRDDLKQVRKFIKNKV